SQASSKRPFARPQGPVDATASPTSRAALDTSSVHHHSSPCPDSDASPSASHLPQPQRSQEPSAARGREYLHREKDRPSQASASASSTQGSPRHPSCSAYTSHKYEFRVRTASGRSCRPKECTPRSAVLL